jgi:hypothetical protein
MKRLFFFVMAVLITFTTQAAEPYRLPFVEIQNGTTKIPFIEQEWVLGTERADWLLYLEKGMFKDQKQPMYEFHGATVYKKPYYSDSVKTEISKIYTYGVLNCNEANLYILVEWYVDVNENIVFKSTHEFGGYVVEMLTPSSARNDVYNQICKETI